MEHENTNALKEALKSYEENPTYGHELNLMLMISIATSLACIADAIMIEEPQIEGLDKIRAEIIKQYKWLMNTGHTIRDVDIAFSSIFQIIDKYTLESEG